MFGRASLLLSRVGAAFGSAGVSPLRGRVSNRALVIVTLLSGCSRGPARIEAPDWDPPALAERILSDLDKNGDAYVDVEELTAAPGLAAGARFIDKDKDGRLSGEEIEDRFEKYRTMRVGLQPKAFRVTYRARPVGGAEVAFLPEPFLEGIIKPAKGTTDSQGIVNPQTEGQELLGMRPGYYRIQIISPVIKIPAKYSSPTALGAEASPMVDDPFAGGAPELRLTD